MVEAKQQQAKVVHQLAGEKEQHSKTAHQLALTQKELSELRSAIDPLEMLRAPVPEWLPEDAASLTVFLRTGTGRSLQWRFAAVVHQNAIVGCEDSMHTAHSAGRAHGWFEAYQWVLSLSRVARVEATNTDEAPKGEAGFVDQFSP